MTTKLENESPAVKPVVTGTGTASEGKVGPALGKVDIGASEKAYLFRVALPGVRSNISKSLILHLLFLTPFISFTCTRHLY